jgi:hypothetical protein
MKEFYTIFYSVTGDIRAKKRVKKSEIPAGHFVIFERRGGRGKLPICTNFNANP